MASNGTISKLPIGTLSNSSVTKDDELKPSEQEEPIDIEGILNGAQLAENELFENKKGQKISLIPIIVDFRRLLMTKSSTQMVPGIDNNDLLHAVVGLYDVSLSEMTPDVLYTTVCEQWARTIILIRDVKDAVRDIKERRKYKKKDDIRIKYNKKETTNSDEKADDVWEPDEEKLPAFSGVYSDSDPEDSESEDGSEEDFSKGINAFLESVCLRKKIQHVHRGPFPSNLIGPENRIIAAATYEKSVLKPHEKIIHLTLVAVRKRFRKWGVGKYLISQIKDPAVVGNYDAVVVHADNSAVDFFERYGFSDDIVLNSRWSDIAEQFTNCTLMSYLPPFTDQTHMTESIPELDLLAMEREIKKWREKSIEAYRGEVTCMKRMRNEIIHLRALVSSQQTLITSLAMSNKRLENEKYQLEKDYLEYRFVATKAAFAGNNYDEMDDVEAEELIRELEKEARVKINAYKLRNECQESRETYISEDTDNSTDVEKKGLDDLQAERHRGESVNGSETYRKDFNDITAGSCINAADIAQISQVFTERLKQDESILHQFQIKHVTKGILHPSLEESYQKACQSLHDSSMMAQLFFCGTLEKPERIKHIFSTGFSEEDYIHGEYGRGLYFSKYPTKAAQFSVLGKVIVTEVALGCTQTVVKKEPTRSRPDENFDSIITPGRLFSMQERDTMLNQEYIVFDFNQAKPLFLIEYIPVFE